MSSTYCVTRKLFAVDKSLVCRLLMIDYTMKITNNMPATSLLITGQGSFSSGFENWSFHWLARGNLDKLDGNLVLINASFCRFITVG